MDILQHEEFMGLALKEALAALKRGEVPVGCVICDENGKIIASAGNRCEELHDATAHAEVEAIRAASAYKNDWRLDGCTLFVTLEPCPMCAGAIINARISTVVFGAKDEVKGSCGSVIDLFSENYPSHPAVFGGILAPKSTELLQSFFRGQRN